MEYVAITDKNDPRVSGYFSMTSVKRRSEIEKEKSIFIAEAQTVIEVALEAGCFPLSILCDERLLNERAKNVIARCEEVNPGVAVYCAPPEVLSGMTGFELTRGILAEMRRPPVRDAAEICRGARRVALLEDIADSANVGAILRCAAGIGIDAVLLTESCCDPLLRRSIRVSMGTALKIPWAFVENARAALSMLGDLGFQSVAMALRTDALSVDDATFARADRLTILLGTEGTGLKNETIAACDHTAIIPMHNGVDSLNVAAAAAVAFWALRPKER